MALLLRNAIVNRLGCLVAQELGNRDTVGRVLMDTKLDALAIENCGNPSATWRDSTDPSCIGDRNNCAR